MKMIFQQNVQHDRKNKENQHENTTKQLKHQ